MKNLKKDFPPKLVVLLNAKYHYLNCFYYT